MINFGFFLGGSSISLRFSEAKEKGKLDVILLQYTYQKVVLEFIIQLNILTGYKKCCNLKVNHKIKQTTKTPTKTPWKQTKT